MGCLWYSIELLSSSGHQSHINKALSMLNIPQFDGDSEVKQGIHAETVSQRILIRKHP